MTAFSDWLEKSILGTIFNGGANFSSSATLYVSLHSGDPADIGLCELPASYSYTRAAIPTNSWSTVLSEGAGSNSGWYVANSSQLNFPQASSTWGTVNYVGIWNSSSGLVTATNGSNSQYFLFGGSLSESRTVNTSDTFRFNAGDLKVILR